MKTLRNEERGSIYSWTTTAMRGISVRRLTWKCKMMVQMRPSVSFGLPVIENVSMKTEAEVGVYRGWRRVLDQILPIYNVFRPDVDQFYLFESKEIKRHLNVLQHVKTHFSFFPRLKNNKSSLGKASHWMSHQNLTKCSPESTSSSDSKLWPSRKSSNRSSTRRDAWAKQKHKNYLYCLL